MPAALAWPMSMKRYNWGYLSEPEPNLNNRRITAPRGKVIGGFAGSTADAFTLFERLEGKLEAQFGSLAARMNTWHSLVWTILGILLGGIVAAGFELFKR